MTSTTISPEQTLTIVKHLAGGKTLDVVATIMRLPRAAIDHIAEQHGHPDRERLAWAVDELTRQVDDASRDRLPTGITPSSTERTRPTSVPSPAAQRPSPAPSAPTPQPTAAPQPAAANEPTRPLPSKPDEFRVLINTAKNHDRKRIQRLAEKILDDCAKLRGLIDDEAAAYAARQAEAKEKAAARAEVERLERELAEAKAKLRPPATEKPASTKAKTSANASTTDEPSTADIRAWAHEHDVDCPNVGRLPQAVRDAYTAAHPGLRAAS